MKTLKIILFALLCGTTSLMAQDTKLINTELKGELPKVLLAAGINSSYSESDKCLDFVDSGINYWYTIKQVDENTFGLTLNRKGYTLKGDNAYLPEPAIKACNEVNLSQFSVKMYCDEDKGSIKLVHQVFLKSCKNLTPEAIKAVLKEMKEANEMFNNVYTAFEKKSSELKAKKQEEARKQAEEEQKRQEEETKEYIIDTPLAKLALTDMKVYSVDAKDKELSKVDTSVRLEDAKYICPLITVVAEEVGTYNILVKIYNEKGKILLYPGNDYSIETPIEVKKAGKDFEYSLDKFGTANGNMWAKGTYTVELFFEEEGELKDLGTKTFEIK